MVIYRSGLTDSSRWDGLVLRPDDIVISTPSKCGTTWLQMICALLVFGGKLPDSLTGLSPWLDMRARPVDEVLAQLDAQRHRRIIKTHTPLDGLPRAEGVTYLVCGRDPREVAVSMVRHLDNLDEERITALLGQRPEPRSGAEPPPLRERVLDWIRDDRPPQENLSSLSGTVWHLADAWRRRDERGIVLLHYAELVADRAAVMRALADRLGIDVAPGEWAAMSAAASLDGMRERADAVAPDENLGLIKDHRSFFRGDSAATWRALMGPEDRAIYEARIQALCGPDEEFVGWLRAGPLDV